MCIGNHPRGVFRCGVTQKSFRCARDKVQWMRDKAPARNRPFVLNRTIPRALPAYNVRTLSLSCNTVARYASAPDTATGMSYAARQYLFFSPPSEGIGHRSRALQLHAFGASAGGEHRRVILHRQRGALRYLLPDPQADHTNIW